MDDLIDAVIEANPIAELSEVPPPKKARTTPTDTIETMEEPDSKIGTTIPKSETQSDSERRRWGRHSLDGCCY